MCISMSAQRRPEGTPTRERQPGAAQPCTQKHCRIYLIADALCIWDCAVLGSCRALECSDAVTQTPHTADYDSNAHTSLERDKSNTRCACNFAAYLHARAVPCLASYVEAGLPTPNEAARRRAHLCSPKASTCRPSDEKLVTSGST